MWVGSFGIPNFVIVVQGERCIDNGCAAFVAYAYFRPKDKVVGADRLKAWHFFTIMGHTLPLARACAAAIKLQCALLLLFVLRNFISWCVPKEGKGIKGR